MAEDDITSLVAEYGARLYTVILTIVADPDDAQDVLQDVWLKATTRMSQLRDVDRAGPWLFAIARNAAVDFVRSRRHTAEASAVKEDNALPPSLRGHDHAPEARLLQTEQRRDIWAALAALSERDRLVLILREFEGRSHKEIAALLGVSPGNEQVIFCRARSRFRDRFHQQQQ